MNTKPVTPKEFAEWLKNNIHKTWFLSKEGGYSSKKVGSGPHMKYIQPTIDTRTMKIYSITTNSKNLSVNFQEKAPEGVDTILDLLDYKIENSIYAVHDLESTLNHDFPDVNMNQLMKALSYVSAEVLDKWWSDLHKAEGKFDWDKQQFTYHEFKERLDKVLEQNHSDQDSKNSCLLQECREVLQEIVASNYPGGMEKVPELASEMLEKLNLRKLSSDKEVIRSLCNRIIDSCKGQILDFDYCYGCDTHPNSDGDCKCMVEAKKIMGCL